VPISVIIQPCRYWLRQELRDFINPKKEDWTLYTNNFEEIGHINVMRYKEVPSIELLRKGFEKVDKNFGVIIPQKVEIIKLSSRTLAPGKFAVEKTIKLNNPRVISLSDKFPERIINGVRVKTLWPPLYSEKHSNNLSFDEINDTSLVLKITIGKVSFLIPGDI